MFALLLMGALGLAVIAAAAGVLIKTSTSPAAVVSEVFGLRTKSTKHCDQCWRVGHRAAAPALRFTALVSTALVILLIILALLLQPGSAVVAVVSVAGAYAISIGLMLMAARNANAATRWVHGTED